MKASPHGIGSDSFRRWVEGLRAELLGQKKRKEDVAFRKTAVNLKPAEVLSAAAEEFQVSKENLCLRMRGSMVRPLTAHLLRKHAGLTQRQVAETPWASAPALRSASNSGISAKRWLTTGD